MYKVERQVASGVNKVVSAGIPWLVFDISLHLSVTSSQEIEI